MRVRNPESRQAQPSSCAVSSSVRPESSAAPSSFRDSSRSLLIAEVTDTGQGIRPADFKRLFQPYFSGGSGTGLGLAIVQRIILEHGGRIRAEANYPRGARFVIELPAATDDRRRMTDDEQSDDRI